MDDLKEWMQNAFNKAYLGLLKQGKPSVAENGCAYISPGGCRCAVGFLLPDDWTFQESMPLEHSSIFGLFMDFDSTPMELLGIPIGQRRPYSKAFTFLNEIQHAHDNPATKGCSNEEWLELWQNKMESIAIEYKLEIPNEPMQT